MITRNDTIEQLYKDGYTCTQIINAIGLDSLGLRPRDTVRAVLVIKALYKKGYKFT